MTRDLYPLTLGEKVAYDVGDGKCLACARRPLHEHRLVPVEKLDDSHLTLICFLGKQYVLCLGTACTTTSECGLIES